MAIVSGWYRYLETAFAASRDVVCGLARHRGERRPNFIVDPATGAKQITVEGHIKARKALLREVRRMKLRLHLRKALLKATHLALKARFLASSVALAMIKPAHRKG